jgi:hypothetical protein
VLASAVVLERGRVAGGWKRSSEGGRVRVTASLRVTLSQTAERALKAAARRYGRFLGKPVDLDWTRVADPRSTSLSSAESRSAPYGRIDP